MTEPLTDDQHTRLRQIAGEPTECVNCGLSSVNLEDCVDHLPALLAEIDRLRETIRNMRTAFDLSESAVTQWQQEYDRLREENTVLGVRWQEQHARAETAEDDVLRAITERNEVARLAAAEIHPGPDAADDEIRRGLIRGWLDEGRDDAEGWREKFQQAVLKPCPHIVTSDDGTSFCGLAQGEVMRAHAEAHARTVERDELIETVRDVAESLGETGSPADSLAAQTLHTACDQAQGES